MWRPYQLVFDWAKAEAEPMEGNEDLQLLRLLRSLLSGNPPGQRRCPLRLLLPHSFCYHQGTAWSQVNTVLLVVLLGMPA